MPQIRYRVDDLPPTKVGAFMPLPTRQARSSAWGLVDVYGAPGTVGIPVDEPADCYGTLSAAGAGKNSTRGSDQSPNTILPVIYYPSTRNMGHQGTHRIGMARRRRAELPIPAIAFSRIAKAVKIVTRKGSRIAQPWPYAFQRYPTQSG